VTPVRSPDALKRGDAFDHVLLVIDPLDAGAL
jgi:hypothetical protein